jgi:hypothetical protein
MLSDDATIQRPSGELHYCVRRANDLSGDGRANGIPVLLWTKRAREGTQVKGPSVRRTPSTAEGDTTEWGAAAT